jgi:hypothetical protein
MSCAGVQTVEIDEFGVAPSSYGALQFCGESGATDNYPLDVRRCSRTQSCSDVIQPLELINSDRRSLCLHFADGMNSAPAHCVGLDCYQIDLMTGPALLKNP